MLPKRAKKSSTSLAPGQYAQSIAILAAFVGFILLFVAAEILLSLRPHPWHWGTALVGGLLLAGVVYVLAYHQRASQA